MEEKIYTLTDKIDKDLEQKKLTGQEKIKLSEELKKLLPQDSIVLAQANPTSGDVKGNALKAMDLIKWAQKLDVSAIVFPELFLIGYPIWNE